MLIDLNAAARGNSLTARPFRRKIIVGTLENFSVGQIVRIAADPLRLQTGKDNFGGVVLRIATMREFCEQYPEAGRAHNEQLVLTAKFYEVGVNP